MSLETQAALRQLENASINYWQQEYWEEAQDSMLSGFKEPLLEAMMGFAKIYVQETSKDRMENLIGYLDTLVSDEYVPLTNNALVTIGKIKEAIKYWTENYNYKTNE